MNCLLSKQNVPQIEKNKTKHLQKEKRKIKSPTKSSVSFHIIRKMLQDQVFLKFILKCVIVF